MWTERACELEAEVRSLARSAGEDPELLRHATECAPCSETLAVARWMRQLSDVPVKAPPLPNAESLWWKAHILRTWERERAVARPIDVGERVQVGVGVIGALVLLVWFWREVQPDAGPSGLLLAMVLSGVVIAATAIAALFFIFTNSDPVSADRL